MFKKANQITQMKLGDFISQVIKEIIDGVSDAQQYAKEKGADINPRHVNWSDSKKSFFENVTASDDDDAPMLTPIDFEILLTIGDNDKVQGGVGIFAASLGLGVKGEIKEYSEIVNRIKFQILAKLPQQKN